jgi:hypothetical protein
MALVIPLKAESTTQGHFPTFAKKASHNNGTCFFLLLCVGSGMKIGRRFVDDVSFYMFLCVAFVLLCHCTLLLCVLFLWLFLCGFEKVCCH